MEHIFSKLRIKTVDADQRIIEGWATTNVEDRAGDIVEPQGAEFDLIDRPIPLLLDHNHSEVIGEIEAAEVTPKGIKFRARVFQIDIPGAAKEYYDRAWQLLKAGARKFVSIGFRALDWVNLPGGGARFTRWEWLELSACAVPCNPEAKITNLKRAPRQSRARKSAKPVRVIKLTEEEKLIGKWRAEADRRAASRERLGIPNPQIKITSVDVMLARSHIRREQRAASKPFVIRTIHRTPR